MTEDLKKKRVENTLKELQELVEGDPELKEWALQTLKEVQKSISLRLPAVMLERIDQVTAKLNNDLKYSPKGNLDRSATIRLLITKGLEAIEAELNKKQNGNLKTSENLRSQ